jgi:hypothetical protein
MNVEKTSFRFWEDKLLSLMDDSFVSNDFNNSPQNNP